MHTTLVENIERMEMKKIILGFENYHKCTHRPLAVWNVNEFALNDCNRTNNIVEGWNNKFSKLVGQKHPSI